MIGLKTDGFDGMAGALTRMYERARDPKTALRIISQKAYTRVIRNFENEIGPDGAWERWHRKDKIFSSRPTRRGGTKMLQDTGAMKNSIRGKVLSRDMAMVECGKTYGVYHQQGTKKMVARPFLWVDEKDEREYADYYAKFIHGGF